MNNKQIWSSGVTKMTIIITGICDEDEGLLLDSESLLEVCKDVQDASWRFITSRATCNLFDWNLSNLVVTYIACCHWTYYSCEGSDMVGHVSWMNSLILHFKSAVCVILEYINGTRINHSGAPFSSLITLLSITHRIIWFVGAASASQSWLKSFFYIIVSTFQVWLQRYDWSSFYDAPLSARLIVVEWYMYHLSSPRIFDERPSLDVC